MQNIFIIEAVSTGRFYAKEIAWRGYHPVVIYPYLENVTDVYKQYRIGGSDYARKFTDDIIFMDSDSSEAYQAKRIRHCWTNFSRRRRMAGTGAFKTRRRHNPLDRFN